MHVNFEAPPPTYEIFPWSVTWLTEHSILKCGVWPLLGLAVCGATHSYLLVSHSWTQLPVTGPCGHVLLPGMWNIFLAYNISNFWFVYQDNSTVNGWTFVYCNPLHCKTVSVALYKPHLNKSILKMHGAAGWYWWNNLPHRATVIAQGLSAPPALPASLNLLPTQTGKQRASPVLLGPTTPHTISDLTLGMVCDGWWFLSCPSLPDWEL